MYNKGMKMIMAVVQDIDADAAIDALIEAGYRITRIASTGGFFRQGNTTFMTGVEEDQVETVLDLVRGICQKRTRPLPVSPAAVESPGVMGGYVEVTVGGATVFVFDVVRYEQL